MSDLNWIGTDLSDGVVTVVAWRYRDDGAIEVLDVVTSTPISDQTRPAPTSTKWLKPKPPLKEPL